MVCIWIWALGPDPILEIDHMKVQFELDEDLVKEAIQEKLDDCNFDSEIESAIESAVADKVDDCKLEDLINSNDILHAMLDVIQSQSFASGAQTERGNARVLGLSRVQNEAQAVSTYCGFGPSQVLEVKGLLKAAPPLDRNVREMGELMTQIRECVGGTMGGGFFAGMLYAIWILESKDHA